MKYLFIGCTVLLFACKATKQATNSAVTYPQNTSLNGKLFTALYQQRSAEYRALCLQGYNVARMSIQNYQPVSSKPKAIITDIDETIMDNSPYAVHQAYKGVEYDQASWYGWTDQSAADTMPGAASFLKYVQANNIRVFYVTNRDGKERNSTLKNLQKFNLPDADETHLVTKSNTSSKELRRQEIMKDYEVVLLMGDNLADFSALFDKKSEGDRKANVDLSVNDFGKKFIVFPNPNYGDWENSLYQYNYKLTQAQKDSVMKSVLRSY